MRKNLKIGVWSFYHRLSLNNYMLEKLSSGLGDDAFYGTNQLKIAGQVRKIEFITVDLVLDWSELDALLVFDYPKPYDWKSVTCRKIVNRILTFSIPSYLVLHECEVIKPNNWIIENHAKWKRIFTWNDAIVDNKKYIKLNMPPRNIKNRRVATELPTKFSTMISTNKYSIHPKEAYSERLKCINWYEENAPTLFDLYGLGWDKYQFKNQNRFFTKINKSEYVLKLLAKKYNVYKGPLPSKMEIFGMYKFHFAYENAFAISGYILEKIFDAFLLGSVPIYFGADNIEQHIPESLFIDLRKFDDYRSLHSYLKGITDNEYIDYLDRINSFFKSDSYAPFSVERYTDTIINHLKTDLLN